MKQFFSLNFSVFSIHLEKPARTNWRMNTENLMKNTKQKARHIVTGFSLWRRTKDSLSLRCPHQPSRAVVRSTSSTAAPFFLSLYRPQDALGQNAHAAERATRLEFTCVPKATTHTQTRMGCCWRRTRDSKYTWDVSPCSTKRQKVRF